MLSQFASKNCLSKNLKKKERKRIFFNVISLKARKIIKILSCYKWTIFKVCNISPSLNERERFERPHRHTTHITPIFPTYFQDLMTSSYYSSIFSASILKSSQSIHFIRQLIASHIFSSIITCFKDAFPHKTHLIENISNLSLRDCALMITPRNI